MGNAIFQIRGHVLEMLASAARVRVMIEAHLKAAGVSEDAPLQYLLQKAQSMLQTHCIDLREHLNRLGGAAAAESPGVPVTHPMTAAKATADVFSRLSFLRAAAMMLETNARALGFASTAALASRHRDEIETLIAQLREVMPQAA